MKKITILLLLTLNIYAHEGHDNPGAVPPAPNGGVLEEAMHIHHGSHNHSHKEANEREIFYEGVYRNNKISIFPLQLDPNKYKHFISLNNKEFKEVKIDIVDARKKEKLDLKFSVSDKAWIIDVSKVRARRFLLDVSGVFKGAKYQAKVQVERK